MLDVRADNGYENGLQPMAVPEPRAARMVAIADFSLLIKRRRNPKSIQGLRQAERLRPTASVIRRPFPAMGRRRTPRIAAS